MKIKNRRVNTEVSMKNFKRLFTNSNNTSKHQSSKQNKYDYHKYNKAITSPKIFRRFAYNNSEQFFNPQTLKEFENIDLKALRREKEENYHELLKAIEELENLNFHFDKHYFSSKASIREAELRNHIKSLSDKIYNSREVESVKFSMKHIYDEIKKNIQFIYEKMREEISTKRKDIQNRITIRLMDAEYKHKMILEEKVREQENMLRSLRSVTSEMLKIKENYEQIRKRIDTFKYKIEENQKKIRHEHMRNNNLKFRLKTEKINLKGLTEKIFNKNQSDKNNPKKPSDPLSDIRNIDSKIGAATENVAYGQLYSNTEPDKISNKVKSAKPAYTNTERNIDKPSKSNKSASLLSHTLGVFKSKCNSTRSKLEELNSCNSRLNKRVYEIISYLKKQNQEEQNKYNSINTEINGNNLYIVSTNSNTNVMTVNTNNIKVYSINEDRKKLVDMLIKDREILQIFYNDKFPTVNIAHRTVKIEK